jgi:hypothetical protein
MLGTIAVIPLTHHVECVALLVRRPSRSGTAVGSVGT